MKSSPIITLYACGGTGINITDMLKSTESGTLEGYAELRIVYIDTSDSNCNSKTTNFYQIKDIESSNKAVASGAGKKRGFKVDSISDAIPDIVTQYPPTDLNIVLHSTGGGSGSTIAPLLTDYLIENDSKVIVVAVESMIDKIEIDNTSLLYQGYRMIAEKHSQVIPIKIVENTKSRIAANKEAAELIVNLLVFFSGSNKWLDFQDSLHSLFLHLVTDQVAPDAYAFDICTARDNPQEKHILSIVSLHAPSGDTAPIEKLVYFQKSGYIPAELNRRLNLGQREHSEDKSSRFPIFMYTMVDGINNRLTTIDNKLSEISNAAKKLSNATASKHKPKVVGSISRTGLPI